VRAGNLGGLRDWAAKEPPRGEVVLVVAGEEAENATEVDAIEVLRVMRRSGLSPSQAAREAAAVTGLPRSDLYRIASSIRLEGELPLANQDALQDSLGDEEDPE
jgi:16S rRNA (cytidine1402-2'-O)-methyltransferase